MTKASPELLAVARRWMAAIPNRRPNDLRNLMTEGDHLRFVGTADGELWSGPAVREGVGAFFGAIPELIKHQETFGEAFENGDTGWACLTHELIFEDQPDHPFVLRNTLIFALEDGAWKVVHRHGSVPIPNTEFTGAEQSAIAELVIAAQQDFSLDQREGFASVMFTDIVNSSGLASIMGDRLWSSEVARHFANLRGIIEANDGQFVKSLGDGTMSSFPSPTEALRAAQAILIATDASDGPAIALRVGVHTGDVVQTSEDFFGTVVNKAARIASVAAANEIRLSDATRQMIDVPHAFRFLDPVSMPLKGFEGEYLLFGLEWQT